MKKKDFYDKTHTQTFNGRWSGTTRVGRYQKKHPLTPILINGHPLSTSSIAYSVFSLRAWQSSWTTSLQVLFVLPLGLGPSTSYSMCFFTQSLSSFCSKCPYQRSLFCCNIDAMSSIPSLSLSSLLHMTKLVTKLTFNQKLFNVYLTSYSVMTLKWICINLYYTTTNAYTWNAVFNGHCPDQLSLAAYTVIFFHDFSTIFMHSDQNFLRSLPHI